MKTVAIDPVCHMNVNEKTAKYTSQYGGVTYYFCSKLCKDSFDKEPGKYLGR
ncbi:Copper-transporting P-type ATPase [Candidatus Calditenuaceae archaeon HR02]|nr:Copper-transporting P-type ATPase [Candidatus Calditenuaceae archaeon HR02]